MSEFLCLPGSGLDFFARPLTSDVDVDADNGLGGRLFTLGGTFGGAGKAPILVVLRTLFPGVGSADDGAELKSALAVEDFLSVGTAGVDCVFVGLGVGNPVVVTDRESGLPAGVAIEEAAEVGRESDVSGISGSGFLVFAIGNAGRGPDGGAPAGGGGLRCGKADVIVAVADRDIALSPYVVVCCCNSPLQVPLPLPVMGRSYVGTSSSTCALSSHVAPARPHALFQKPNISQGVKPVPLALDVAKEWEAQQPNP